MDGFKIRQATLADKADVLGIHDHVYEGHDYLPEFYDYLLSLEDARAFVLQHEGKIVSICIHKHTSQSQTRPELSLNLRSKVLQNAPKGEFSNTFDHR